MESDDRLGYVPDGLDYWEDEDSEFPVSDWQFQIEEGGTRLGYWEWAYKERQAEIDTDKAAAVAANVYSRHPHRTA